MPIEAETFNFTQPKCRRVLLSNDEWTELNQNKINSTLTIRLVPMSLNFDLQNINLNRFKWIRDEISKLLRFLTGPENFSRYLQTNFDKYIFQLFLFPSIGKCPEESRKTRQAEVTDEEGL